LALLAIPRRAVGVWGSGPTESGRRGRCGLRPSVTSFPVEWACPTAENSACEATPSACGGLALSQDSSPCLDVGHRGAQAPAGCRVRVAPAVPQELAALHRRCPRQERLGPPQGCGTSLPACHGLRTPAALPLLAWSEAAWSLRERANPRHPHSPCRSCPSTSGCAVTPAASRIRCRRCAPLVHPECPHDSAMDARRDTGGWLALPRPGLAPC
jgi:hypothetical protein